METEFWKFLEVLPYTKYNRWAYSPRLLSMLLQICGYIDTVFKEMAKFRSFRRIPDCRRINDLETSGYEGYHIGLARSAFDEIYKLSSNNGGELIAKLDWVGDQRLYPFSKFNEGTSPEWWHAHNKVKHNWSKALRQVNMDNALLALSGAFLINAIHYPSMELLWRLGSLDIVIETAPGLSELRLPESTFKELLKTAIKNRKPLGYDFIIETPLFIYSSKVRKEK